MTHELLTKTQLEAWNSSFEVSKLEKENAELRKDKERLEWLLDEYGVTWGMIECDDRITREGIDKEMTESGYKNMKEEQ